MKRGELGSQSPVHQISEICCRNGFGPRHLLGSTQSEVSAFDVDTDQTVRCTDRSLKACRGGICPLVPCDVRSCCLGPSSDTARSLYVNV